MATKTGSVMAHRVLAAEFSSKSNQKSAMYVRFLDQGKQKVNSTKSNGQNKPVRTEEKTIRRT